MICTERFWRNTMRRKARRIVRILRNYYHRCRFCHYAGSDWPDSGECPSCGEIG